MNLTAVADLFSYCGLVPNSVLIFFFPSETGSFISYLKYIFSCSSHIDASGMVCTC